MTYLIDRRLQSKNKSAVNRERFLRRYKGQIKQAVERAIKGRSITDIASGEKISIPARDVTEPTFGHSHGGIWEVVNPGNEEYLKGDRVSRPRGGGGGGGGGKSGNSDETTQDDFVFELSREEFMNYFFEDLELPNMVKKQLASHDSNSRATAPVIRSPARRPISTCCVRCAARWDGASPIGGKHGKRLARAEEELENLLLLADEDHPEVVKLRHEIAHLKMRINAIPFIDPFDLRYSNRVKMPKPSSQAVMFCVMDVSGSMDEQRKDTAKRFFILLYLFLTRAYDKIEVVFIRHHTAATEVDEHEFFNSRESGGTVVSSALHLLQRILHERYPGGDWNVYVAQASDGDNWDKDSVNCRQILNSAILPAVQYYAYVEITDGAPQNLWHEYAQVAAQHPHFAMQKIESPSDIYPVFRELFKKQPK